VTSARLFCVVALGGLLTILIGCQVIHRSATYLGLETGFSLARYDDQRVAVFPVVTNPAFPLSDADRKSLRDVLIKNLKLVAKFHPVPEDGSAEQSFAFPYLPETQSLVGRTLGFPATIGISVPSSEVAGSGSMRQLTITVTFVDSLNLKRQVTATQIYRSPSPTEALNLRGPGFDLAVLLDLMHLRASISTTNRSQATNATVGTSGPSILAVIDPQVVSDQSAPNASDTAVKQGIYSTSYEALPIRVFANDDNGLKRVELLNRTTKDQIVLLDSQTATHEHLKYFDKSVEVKLAPGTNSLMVSGANIKGGTFRQTLDVERLPGHGSPMAFLAVDAIPEAVSSPSTKELWESMRPLVGGSDPSFLTILSGMDANFQEILSIARTVDRTVTPIHGVSIVYFVGKISATDEGMRLIPFTSRFNPQVSGMPLDGILVAIAPRLVFLDLCASDPGHLGDQMKMELSRGSDQMKYRSPVVFSARDCAEPYRAPIAEGLVASRRIQAPTQGCVTFRSLLDSATEIPGVTSIGSLSNAAGAICIARQ
jgi:hypothetical protein